MLGRSKNLFLSGIAVVSAVAFASVAQADYPDRPVTLTVGFGPGGPSDISARFLQKHFNDVTGEDLIIVNKPGGGGAASWSTMNQQEADGYNLTLVSLPHIVMQPVVTPNVGYNFDDINSVLIYTSVPQVLAVPASSEIQTLEEFLAMAKGKPGQVTIAGTGSGGSNHSAHHLFDTAAGIETVYIPFKDTASTMAALKGGQTDAAWTWATQGIHDGEMIRMLGLAADERMDLFTDLPTMKEQGIEMTDQAWWAIGVPADTTENIRAEVAATFLEVLSGDAIKKEMIAAGYVPYVVEPDKVEAFTQNIYTVYEPVAHALTN